MQRSLHDQRGVTIIEVLLAVFVVGLVGIAITTFSRSLLRNSRMAQTALQAQSQVRRIQQTFLSEVRSAMPAWDGSAIIDTASTTEVVFFANVDSDQYTEKVRYYASSSVFYKSIQKFNTITGLYDGPIATSLILQNVAATSGTRFFSYFDKDYTGSTTTTSLPMPVDLSRVRMIKFDLPVYPYGKSLLVSELHTVQASIRNLKDNY